MDRFLRASLYCLLVVLARANDAMADAAPKPQFNIPVNNPLLDTPAGESQSNPSMVDLGGGRLVSIFGDSKIGADGAIGHAISTNGGLTWTDAGATGVDRRHLANIALRKADMSILMGGGGKIFRSIDGGLTFESPITVYSEEPSDYPMYGGHVAVDNYPGGGFGNIYYCHYGYIETWGMPKGAGIRWGYYNLVYFARAVDGATFSSIQIAAGDRGDFPPAFYDCTVTVSPNHQVNVFYGYNGLIYGIRSSDFGASFTRSIVISGWEPRVAINPVASRPTISLVYRAPDTTTPANSSELYITQSLDSGATWLAPAKANDDARDDQSSPSIAALPDRLMITYDSRSNDPATVHRRGRIAALGATGALGAWRPSFQIGPDTTGAVGGQNGTVATNGAFLAIWADMRRKNSLNAYQSDVYFSRIALPMTVSDVGLSITASSPTIPLGALRSLTITATAHGGPANDVVVNFPEPVGLALLNVTSSDGACFRLKAIASCSLGSIPAEGTKSIGVTFASVMTPGSRNALAVATSSSVDGNKANNTAILTFPTVSNPRLVQDSYSTGSIVLQIPGGRVASLRVVETPLNVTDVGNVIGLGVRLRVDFNRDSDLRISLVSPSGESVALAGPNPVSGRNFGSGSNDCSGTFTSLNDAWTTPLSSGRAPFNGNHKPNEPILPTFGYASINGVWKLRFQNLHPHTSGVVGCAEITILRKPPV